MTDFPFFHSLRRPFKKPYILFFRSRQFFQLKLSNAFSTSIKCKHDSLTIPLYLSPNLVIRQFSVSGPSYFFKTKLLFSYVSVQFYRSSLVQRCYQYSSYGPIFDYKCQWVPNFLSKRQRNKDQKTRIQLEK